MTSPIVSGSDADRPYSTSQEAELVLYTDVDMFRVSGARYCLQSFMALEVCLYIRRGFLASPKNCPSEACTDVLDIFTRHDDNY